MPRTFLTAFASAAVAASLSVATAASSAGGTRADQKASWIHRTCPKAARHTAKSHEPDADRVMVPAGARSVLLCRYRGANPIERYQDLDAARLIRRSSTVQALLRGINSSRPYSEGLRTCHRDDGAKAVAFFHYSRVREAAVVIHLGGCTPVSNGYLRREGNWETVRLIVRLTR